MAPNSKKSASKSGGGGSSRAVAKDGFHMSVSMDKAASWIGSHMKTVEATLADRSNDSVKAFKGKRLITAMVEGTAGGLDKITTREDAMVLAQQMLKSQKPVYFVGAKVVNKSDRRVAPQVSTTFSEDELYLWTLKGSQTMIRLLLVGLVVAFFGIILFPLWPRSMKIGVFWLCVGLLVLLLGSILLRLVLWFVTWMLGYEVWILPNVFEDVDFEDAFTPIIGHGWVPRDHWPYRLVCVALIGLSAYWIITQPTEFERFLQTNKDFVNRMYTGSFLDDKAADGETREEMFRGPKDHVDIGLSAEDLFGAPAAAESVEDGFDEDGVYDFHHGLDDVLDRDDL